MHLDDVGLACDIRVCWDPDVLILRPFIGQPDAATTLFRDGGWGNADSELLHIAWRFVGGR